MPSHRARQWSSRILLLLGLLTPAMLTRADSIGFPQYPALSPDGSTLVFSWAGDLWGVPSAGGTATRLTAHPALERRSAFSPDGSTLAFESNRDGPANLYTMPVDTRDDVLVAGQPTRATTADRAQTLSGFSADGSALLFSSSQEPSLYRQSRLFRAPLDGGPTTRLTDAFGFRPRQAANGDILFTRGYASIANRPKYRGPGAMQPWRFTPSTGTFTKVVSFDGNAFDPHQLPDGSVVYLSSRTGENNLFRLSTSGRTRSSTQLTNFAPAPSDPTIGHGVRDLTVSADGSLAAFAVWDTLYTLDLTDPGATPRPVPLSASADDATADVRTIDVSTNASETAMHPSGAAVAIVTRGELYIRSTADDHPARRVTHTSAREHDLAWSPDGTTLYFVRDTPASLGSVFAATVTLTRADLDPAVAEEPAPEDTPAADEDDAEENDADAGDPGASDKPDDEPKPGDRWAGALAFEVAPVLDTPAWERTPLPSPDGRSLLVTRGLGDLILLNLADGAERTLFTGWNAPDVRWASDSQHIVYELQDLDFNSDIWLRDTASDAPPINLTRHPDLDVSPQLSSDGKVLTFLSDRGGQNWDFDVYTIYLDKALERMRPYELETYYKDAAKAAKKLKPLPVTDDDDAAEPEALTFDADDAYLRVRRLLSVPGGADELAVTPAADRVVFAATIDDTRGLYSVNREGKKRKKLASGGADGLSVSLTGDKAVFIQRGTVKSTPTTGGDTDTLSIDAELRVDVAEEQRQKFTEGARTFGATFYHPTMKGLDWEPLWSAYADLASKTRTSAAFNRVFTLLLGEVEGSHTGIFGGDAYSADYTQTGHLGADTEPAPDGYRLTRVIDEGPAALAAPPLEPGDVITAVAGAPVLRRGVLRDLPAALAGRAGHETLLTVRRDADPEFPGFVLVTPIGAGPASTLRYEDGVRTRRAEVDRLSGGRLGYLHIRGMNLPSVRTFERDLFAAADGKEGLIIDVRDNGGGFTTDILLASLTAPNHAYTVPRGADARTVPHDAYPRDRRLIYAWNRPINVLINENSFSNAEIFAHAIKTTGRGPLIGTQTFGGVISTGGFRLIDGTFIRQPFRGWYLPDGTDMESHGAIPDVPVEITPADEAAGRRPQLEAAVAELLGRLDTPE